MQGYPIQYIKKLSKIFSYFLPKKNRMKKLIPFFVCISFVLHTKSLIAQVGIENKKFENGKVINVPANKVDSLGKKTEFKNTNIEGTPKQDDTKKDIQLPTKPQEQEGKADAGHFRFYKPAHLLMRDTLGRGVGELQVVKISEELKIDCVWVKSAEYYSIWDSKNINPYNWDAKKLYDRLKDTVKLKLYNKDIGELWAMPLEINFQTSAFGPRWGSFHSGIDFNLQNGTPVYAVFDGIVRISTFGNNGYGNYVVIRHKNGLETLYGHFSARKVEAGQEVKAGQLIGLGGSTGWSTGPHLHFEVRYAGYYFNPNVMYDFGKKDEQLLLESLNLNPSHFAHHNVNIRQTITHQVKPGETLSSIGAKYGVSVYIIAKKNQISINSPLKIGQMLIIN